MKYLIEEATLTGIADAVREKKGTTDLIQVSNLATEISNIQGGGTVEELTITSNGTYNPPTGIDGFAPIVVNVPQDGSPPESAFNITGDCSYRFANKNWNWFIEKYGNQITTNKITNAYYLFYNNRITSIPFTINVEAEDYPSFKFMFWNCQNLKTPPEIRITYLYSNSYWPDMERMFYNCNKIQIDRDYFNRMVSMLSSEQIEKINSQQYNDTKKYLFSQCCSLRSAPDINVLAQKSSYATIYVQTFYNCAGLDDITDMPVVLYNLTSNRFDETFYQCVRLKKLTFKMVDGAPQIINWSKQTIDLTQFVGYGEGYLYYSNLYNDAKKITDDATYQALKDDPDCWTTNINYSRYNHNSAVETINSLPDVSGGSGNTIKFKGQSGASTDGGAINTLTEEEIAVATAKGWSVALV